MPKEAIILSIDNVSKRRGKVWVLKDVSFRVERGSILGLLGPNGAGKTTLMEIISGISYPDRGTVKVGDPACNEHSNHQESLVGAQLQETSLHAKGTVLEHLQVFSSFYSKPVPLKSILEFVKLDDKKDVYYMHLSGGEKQRLALAMVLVGDPSLILMDEPTTGLDAHMRNDLHAMIIALKSTGKSILLCTHYIEEAEKLSDKVAILDRGQILAMDSPVELKKRLPSREHLELVVDGEVNEDWFLCLPGVKGVMRKEEDVFSIWGESGHQLLDLAINALRSEGKAITSSRIVNTSLEDVFIELTGNTSRSLSPLQNGCSTYN